MKQIIIKISLIFFCCIFILPAENNDPNKQSVYFELLGNGLLYSINYERMISTNISARLGAGFSMFDFLENDDIEFCSIPIFINYLEGENKNKIEAGVGGVFLHINNDTAIIPGLRFGYAYIPDKDGSTFRIAYTPFLPFKSNTYISHWFGISFGCSF